jgi:hypothetical protein
MQAKGASTCVLLHDNLTRHHFVYITHNLVKSMTWWLRKALADSASQSQTTSTAADAGQTIFFGSKVSTTVGGKASLQPKRTPMSNEEIEAILVRRNLLVMLLHGFLHLPVDFSTFLWNECATLIQCHDMVTN